MPETKDKKAAVAAAKTAAPKAKKTEAKKSSPAAKKPAIKKVAEKPVLSALDVLTTAVWNKLEKADVSKIEQAIAVQVNVIGVGTFYIAINANENEKKQVIQAEYYLNDAVIETSADEVKKIAAGGYNYLDAVKNGKLGFCGNLAKGVIIAELLK